MKRFKAVIFDLGGVLSLGQRYRGVHKMVAKKLNMSVDQYFDSIDEVYSDAISGKIPQQKALDLMAKNLGTSSSKLKKIYFQAYRKNFKRNESLYSVAIKLKGCGYKISIISDIWSIAEKALLDKKNYPEFNDIVVSYKIGVRKTNPKIFRIALKRLKINPKEAIFTDNRAWNLVAPKELGMTPILYKNTKQFIKELKRLGIDI